jgi:hypothetical protein
VIAPYLSELTARLEERLGDRLVAAWVVGSTALGDFDALRSDVDVQAVVSRRLDRAELEQLAGALASVPCPVRGLEFVLYAQEDLSDPKGPAFSLNLNTGPRMEHHAGYDPDAEPRFWFTLDVSIARQQSRRLAGLPAETVLPALPRELVIAAAKEALEFWRAYDRAQAILSACRAAAWAAHGRWLSKGEAAAWATKRLADPAPVAKALARRADPDAPEPTAAEFAAVIDQLAR